MRIEIGWIICLLFYGTTVGHSADFAPSAHLPCEQLHKARHYLSVGDFARCADELRTVRQACDHRECLEQAELLQRDCESKAMMALLKSPPPAAAELKLNQLAAKPSALQTTKAEPDFSPLANAEAEPKVGTAAVDDIPPGVLAETIWKPAAANAHVASEEAALLASTAAAPEDVSRSLSNDDSNLSLTPPHATGWSGLATLLQSWSITLLLIGIFSLQVLMWTRRRTLSNTMNSRGTAAGNNQGEPSREADVFAQIMLKNVHLREQRGDSNKRRPATMEENSLTSTTRVKSLPGENSVTSSRAWNGA